jgi:tetratricopeptide (TPR) repeat protein
MAQNVPTVRQIAWISLIPHMSVLGVLILIYYLLNVREAYMAGAINYLIISFSLRTFIPKDHRKGISLVHRKEFKDAIPYFEKSADFFTRYEWVDKYRYLTLLNSSAMSYKEMALCNIAFCYGQTGNGKKAVEYYNAALKEFPNSSLASTGLTMLNSMTQDLTGNKEAE